MKGGENIPRPSLRGLSRNVILLGLVSLLADVSSEMIHPILPVFIVGLGASYAIVGLIEGLSDTLANLLKVAMGWYSDRLRRRKPFIAFGYAPTAIMKPFLALATSWEHVLGIRLIERAGKGVRTAPRDALISESVSSERRGTAFGLHRAMDSAGAIIGTVIALVLILFVLDDTVDASIRTIFVLSAIPAAISVLVVVFFIREHKTPGRALSRDGGFLKCLRGIDPQLRHFLVIVILIGFANASYAFFILRAVDFGADLAFVLLLYIAMNLMYTLFSIPAGMLSDRIGRKPMITSGLILFSFTSGIMAFAWDITVVFLGFLLYGVFLAIEEVNQRAFASELAKTGEQGTALGAYHTVVGLTALPAAVLFGTLWDIYGVVAAFAFGATVALVAALLFSLFVGESRKISAAISKQ